jgi:hypothetical protein
MDKESLKILEEINKSLNEINTRQKTSELFMESDKLFAKSDARVENSLNQIQNSLDRIHDKVFNFNNILIGAYLVLGTFPSSNPTLRLWVVVFPILNLIFMVYLDIRQMEIHRFASREQHWTSVERDQHGHKIEKQTRMSLLSFFLSLMCLIYLVVKLL